MAALGTNMGKKPDKKEMKAPDKPKKKVAVKTDTKKASTIKPTKKKEKVVVKSTPVRKVVATKTSDAKKRKKVVATKPVQAKKQAAAKMKASNKATGLELKARKPSPKKSVASPTSQKVSARAISIAKESKPLRNAKLILEPSKRKKIRKTKVILEGDLNINNVDAFMAQIEPIFDDYDYVDFFQREVTSIDLCHIQMLYYFKNHPTRKSKTVTINSELSTDLKKLATNAGFKEFMFIPKLV